MRSSPAAVILLFLLCGGLSLVAAEMTPSERYAAKALDEVWREVAANHFRADFDALYRKSVYEKFRPQILASPDRAALIANLNKMLAAIGDSHLRVFGPVRDERMKAVLPVEKPGKTQDPVDPGFSIIDDGERLRVRNVIADSEPCKKGIRPGDVVLNIEGMDFPAGRDDGFPPRGMLARALLTRGGEGSFCAVKLRSADGTVRDFKLIRSCRGGRYFQVANLPRQPMNYEVWRLDEHTGYLRFDLFVPEVVKRFRKDLRKGSLEGVSQLIIDLRGNPGGILLSAEWLGSWCLPEKTPFGELEKSGVRLTPVSEPQPNGFRGKLVVLVDGETLSTGELFAAAVQDAKAGIIVGTKTPGKCLPSLFFNLACGLRLQTISGSVRRPSGKMLEGIGVTPDVIVPNSFADRGPMLLKWDLVIEKAMELLKEQGK